MDNKKITSIKYLSIGNREEAIKIYQDMMQAYLELRLSSRHAEIKNYAGQKNIMKKNMARALTYLKRVSLDNLRDLGIYNGK
jgi:ribosomal protein L29